MNDTIKNTDPYSEEKLNTYIYVYFLIIFQIISAVRLRLKFLNIQYVNYHTASQE